MQLEEYLKKENMKIALFARKIGVSYHILYNLFRGGKPRLETAQAIIEGTKGEVTLSDLLQIKRSAIK